MRANEPEAFQYGHFEHAHYVNYFISYIPLNHELNAMIHKAIHTSEKAELKRKRQE